MEKKYLKVSIATEGLSQDEMVKVLLAEKHMEKAINSKEFKDFVLNYEFSYSYYTGRFWWKRHHVEHGKHFTSTHLTNYQVYEKIMSGAETLSPEHNHEADIFLKIDRHNKKSVLGYTYQNTKWQWAYISFFRRASVKQLAGNMMHEWLHKISFGHDFKRTARRPFSVNYAIGYWVSNYEQKS